MRVLMIHNDYQLRGGEYHSVRSEVAGLEEAGVAVRTMFVNNDAIEENRLGPLQIFSTGGAYKAVSEAISEFRPDVVHAQNLFPLLGSGAIRAIRDSGLPWVRTLRNYRIRCVAGTCFRDDQICTDCDSAARPFSGIRHRCYRGTAGASAAAGGYAFLEDRAERDYPPAAYITLNPDMASLLGERGRRAPIHVKYNSVEIPAQPERQPTGDSRQFTFVGRLSQEKGLGVVIEAMAKMSDCSLVVIGDGHSRESLEALSRDLPNIHFMGALPPTDVYAQMRQSIAVVVPSLWEEPFGRVAVEALATGVPALVSNHGGLPHLVGPISRDLVVPVDSADAWRSGLSWIAGLDDEERARLSTLCVDHWRKNFTQAGTAKQLLDIYRAALSGFK